MRLSVAIITYNRSSEVMNAVGSIIGQLADDDQIVIVDNGSGAGHATALDEYCNRLHECGYDVLLEHVDSNLGVAGGRNIAWQCSTRQTVLFLDDDCVVADGKLVEKIRQYLSENDGVGALAIRIVEPITGGDHYYDKIHVDSSGHKLIGRFNGTAHVIDKRTFEVEKLYPDTLFWGAEEYYASLRIWGQGLQVHLLPDTEVLHYPETTCEGRVSSLHERDENQLASSFVICCLLLPSVMMPAVVIAFILRLFYHKIRYGIGVRKVLHLARERYDSNYKRRIPMKAVLDYASKFGYNSVL